MHVKHLPVVSGGKARPIAPMCSEAAIATESLAHRELSESEARYRAVIDTAVNAIVVINADGLMQSANRAAEYVFGYGAAELIGRTIDLLLPASADIFKIGISASLGVVGARRELAGRRKDGSEFPVELSVGEWTVDGRRFFTGIMRDITARKSARASLRQATARLAAVLEHTSDTIIVLEHTGRIIFANKRAQRRFGFLAAIGERARAGAGLIGSSLWAIWPDASVAATRAIVLEMQQRQTPHQFEVAFPAQDTWFEVHAYPWQDGAALYLRDISDRKRAERDREALERRMRQSAKMQALGTLAGGIAHDFNNLLLVIVGLVDVARDLLPPDSEARTHLDYVLQAADRANDLVKQILAFSRRDEPRRERVKLCVLVDGALDLLEAAAPKSIVFERYLDFEGEVMADPGQLHQVVLNLGANALDAIGGRGGGIRIGLTSVVVDGDPRLPLLRSGPYARLVVGDDGEGMPPDIAERVLEPFFTTKAIGKGTGLGLAVVHGIVTNHEGGVFVDSAPGHGTRVTVYLPLAPAAEVA